MPGNVMATCILQYTPEQLEARRSKRVRYNESTSIDVEEGEP